MIRSPDTDVVIIGAGLAGLSIAAWLADIGTSNTVPQVTLLDARQDDANEHTWCFWDQQPHPFRDAICHRWPRWRVRHGGREVVREDAQACYAMLDEAALRGSAEKRLQDRTEFTLRRGVKVTELAPDSEGISLHTTEGALKARLVIDTRPPELSALRQRQGMWQVFHGLELQVPGHGYDPSTVTLMDFQPSDDGIHFIYLLPLSANSLLVEWTCFHVDREAAACQALLQPDLPQVLLDWLRGHLPQWSVTRHETGCLPMMPVRPPTLDERYLAAGMRGGWMRPATGYSFETCQRAAQSVARQVIQARASGHWKLAPPPVRTPVLNWMDRVFLHAMRRQPEQAPEWFMQMFAATAAGQQRRFLGDVPGYGDMLAMMRALPAGPFVRSALATAPSSIWGLR